MSDSAREGGWKELFNGQDLAGWRALSADGQHEWQAAGSLPLHPEDPRRFAIGPGEGILVNGPGGRTPNLLTADEYGDCELHIEFVMSKGSNSGVYFMGHYEIQVLDSWGATELKYGTCGGIYARWIDEKAVGGTPPRVNASRPPGEWQTYDVTFRAPKFDAAGNKVTHATFVRVVWNGVVVHENVEVDGPTRGAMPGPERPRGPLMLQGDHGPVGYRNIRLREIG
jgi:hypothetical protein